jgi:hypothetical protein
MVEVVSRMEDILTGLTGKPASGPYFSVMLREAANAGASVYDVLEVLVGRLRFLSGREDPPRFIGSELRAVEKAQNYLASLPDPGGARGWGLSADSLREALGWAWRSEEAPKDPWEV